MPPTHRRPRSLPVDLLKIDGRFVRSIEHDRIDRVKTQTINDVAPGR